ncbi:MAG: hypothetical protein RL145_1288 [Pseudomonadota bacterium]
MAISQALPSVSSHASACQTRAGSRQPWAGLGLSLVMLGAGLVLMSEPVWAQARGGTVPMPAPKPSGPAPVVIPPVSAEPISARLIIRLEQVERQAAELTGRIEVLEAELSQQRARHAQLMRELEAERANKVALAKADPATVESSGAEPSAAQALTNEMPAAAAASVEAAPPPSAEALFNAAQLALQRGDYLTAESNLNSLVTNFPAAPEGVEGRWLLGEARFVQSAWGPAAEAYLSYLDAAPQGRRASESLVRLAGAFGQMGNPKMRCQALAEFKRRTPSPDPTLKARADAEVARSPCPTT